MAPFMAPANVALALCLGATLVWRFKARSAGEAFFAPFRRTTPVHLPIAAFVLLSVVSAIFSTLPSRSLQELKGFTTFLLVPFAAALLKDEDDVDVTIDLWRISALIVIGRGFAEVVDGRGGLAERLTGGLSSHMTFSGLLLPFVLVLLARAVVKGRSALDRALDGAIAALGTAALMMSLTRSAWLGFAAGLAAFFLASRPRLLILVPVLAGLLVAAGPEAVTRRALSMFDRSDATVRDRVVMWEAGVAMVRDHPLTGLGPGRVKELYPEYRRPGYVEPRPGHLHNNLIMIAAETGLPSLAAYLWFLVAFLRGAAPLAGGGRSRVRAISRGAVAALAALFVAGLFEYNFGDVEILRVTLLLSVFPFLTLSAGREPEAAPAGAKTEAAA